MYQAKICSAKIETARVIILTNFTTLMHIVVDKSTNNTKLHSIQQCVKVKENVFLVRAEKCIICATQLCQQHCLYSHQQWQISQSDYEISSNGGKNMNSKLRNFVY